jgi:hypothetical protein
MLLFVGVWRGVAFGKVEDRAASWYTVRVYDVVK